MESIVSAATFNDNITGLRKQTSMRSTILLPEDFILSSSDVLCGRGSQCFNHEGNRKFRKLVESRLQRYSGASTKHDKTQIICEIIDLVRQDSPLGGFVKRDLEAGRYYEVGDFHAVSYSLDDLCMVLFFALFLILSFIVFSGRRLPKPFETLSRRNINQATSHERNFANVFVIVNHA
jgi:hypothetical protein